jgi:kynurenine formamidase
MKLTNFISMILTFSENIRYQVDLKMPLDISIPLRASSDNPTAWYVDPPKIEAVKTEQLTGSVAEGGSVNFRNIFFNPHGHGTHTECVGHISKEVHSINQNLKQFFFTAEVISIKPEQRENGDQVISLDLLKAAKHKKTEAIVIRTIPNHDDKLSKQYSNTNPAYLDADAIHYLVEEGIDHLLVDLPSVDREEDGGELASHHAFWNYPEDPKMHRTITELIFVPNAIADGLYLLNLQIAPFENDASPSKPVLYAMSPA